MDKHDAILDKHHITPCTNFHKQQALPLRSDWRFAESGAVVFGNVEIRRPVALFWTRVNTRFCAVTHRGLLLIYGETEKGLAIDLKALHAVNAKIDMKKVNGTHMPRCLLTLHHECGEWLVMCLRGKTEIARWRCAITNAVQQPLRTPLMGGGGSSARSASLCAMESEAAVRTPSPVDPEDIDYWNNPAAGKQMSSPRIYRAVSQHGLMHVSMMNSSTHSNLVHNLSMNSTTAITSNEHVQRNGSRKYRTLPRKSSMRRSAVASFTVGSFRKQRESPSPRCNEDAVPAMTWDSVPDVASTGVTSPDPSLDSGLASAIHSPARRYPDEIDVEVDDAFLCDNQEPMGESMAQCGTVYEGCLEYVPEYLRRPRIVLPILSVETLNIEGIFQEVLSYLRDECTQTC